MAKTVNVIVTDDIDGSDGAQPVLFSYQGSSYEIDLTPANRDKFSATLAPFVQAARRAGAAKRPVRTAAVRQDRAAIRAWAREQGMSVSERGRISSDIIEKYQAAH
jgi:Lsr2